MKNILKAAKLKGYKQWPKNQRIPKNLENLLRQKGAGQYGETYFNNLVFYRGDPDNTRDWIIVFNGGACYKSGADYMIWYLHEVLNEIVGRACWSDKFLTQGIIEFFETGEISRDPQYQT